jgi:hypothetical protein
LQEVFLSKTNSILTAKQCTDALGSKKMVFFTDVYVFQLSITGLFATK